MFRVSVFIVVAGYMYRIASPNVKAHVTLKFKFSTIVTVHMMIQRQHATLYGKGGLFCLLIDGLLGRMAAVEGGGMLGSFVVLVLMAQYLS